MRWAIACVALCACGRVGFALRTNDESADGSTSDGNGATACASWGAWSAPTMITGINSAGIDWSPSISDDALRLTFSSNRTGNHELFVVTRPTKMDAWSAPAQITELTSSTDEEDDATTSADELEMIFGKTQIFRTTRPNTAATWTPRVLIVPPDFDLVQGAELSRDNLRLYFGAGSPTLSLYMMERPLPSGGFNAYARVMPDPDPGNDPGYPTLSADELELYVSSNHGGEREIFVSRRVSRTDPFPQVVRENQLSELGADDWDPEISADGTTMYLSTSRAGSQGLDLFVATRACAD